MTMTMAIDTLKISKRLENAGFDQKAAEELVEVMKEIQEDSKSELATKQDVTEVKRVLMIIISLGGIIALIEKFIKWN